MDWPAISARLLAEGLISNLHATCQPLTGGVSSDIFLIADGNTKFVLKQALARLKVKDIWEADISRNQVEQDFIHLADGFMPGTVPKILYSAPELGFFIMEHLDDSYVNWKVQLMDGFFENSTATRVARILATIHSKTRSNPGVSTRFDTTQNFKGLRIDPYLVTTGQRNPHLKGLFLKEAHRLEKHREALVHGDFSPKNLLVSPERVVLLDHEVAWYGDPAFDLGFLFTHLYFKMLINRRHLDTLPDLSQLVWDEYFKKSDLGNNEDLKERAGRLLLMIMLGRLDGKSPVEYWLKDSLEAKFVRSFVNDLLPRQRFDQEYLNQEWRGRIKQLD